MCRNLPGMSPRGRFIVLEGGEGVGKTTQAERLAVRLGARLTRKPGGTVLGEATRTLLLDPRLDSVAPRAELLLMVAARAQHVAEVIRPALDEGRWVVTDRFSASTLAYQGYGRGLDPEELAGLIGWATGGLRPDLTILVDVPVALASERRAAAGSSDDRFEGQAGGFHQRVADGYHRLAASGATPWLVVDGTGPVDAVAAAVWSDVAPLVGPR